MNKRQFCLCHLLGFSQIINLHASFHRNNFDYQKLIVHNMESQLLLIRPFSEMGIQTINVTKFKWRTKSQYLNHQHTHILTYTHIHKSCQTFSFRWPEIILFLFTSVRNKINKMLITVLTFTLLYVFGRGQRRTSSRWIRSSGGGGGGGSTNQFM